jgi:hypothetical protein
MAHECRFSASWAILKTDPPCPPCDEARASRIWPDYYREIHPESDRQDVYLCAAYAAFRNQRRRIAGSFQRPRSARGSGSLLGSSLLRGLP